MTGTIIYTSEEEFEPDYKKLMESEVVELSKDHVWWNQPLLLVEDPNDPDVLDGTTQLIHRYLEGLDGQRRSVDYRDDMLMGMVDYSHIIGILAALSHQHEFSWNLCYPATPRPKQIGMIREGEIEPRVFEFLLHEMQALEITDEDLENEMLHATIRAKYFTEDGAKIVSPK